MKNLGGTVGAVCALAAVLAVALVSAQGGHDGYTVTLLPNPDAAPYTYAQGISDSGRIVGVKEVFVAGFGWVQTAQIWPKYDEDPEDLEPLSGDPHSLAFAVNNRREACGFSTDYATTQKAVIWGRDGDVVDMHPDLGGFFSQGTDINQYGDLVGITYGPGYARAFIHLTGDDAELLAIDTDGYASSWAYEINKHGVVVGFARLWVNGGAGYTRAVYWDEDGDMVDLHTAMEDDLDMTLPASKAWYVTDHGEIGGVVVVTLGSEVRPFVWTEDDGFAWVDADDEDLAAVNSGGGRRFCGLVGSAIEGWWTGAGTAAVWDRRVRRGVTTWTLETLPKPNGMAAMIAEDMNTSGRVVGTATDADGLWYAWYADD